MDRIKTFMYLFLMNNRLLNVFKHPMSESWAVTRKHLTEAIQYLPEELQTEEKLKNYNEYMAHNELELSLDALIDLVEEITLPIQAAFWKHLQAAAVEMKLQEKVAHLDRILQKT
jgi:hypothetical protein